MAHASFQMRNAGTSAQDADFIVAAFDSSVAHLAATGNAEHWGTQPFSEKEGFTQSVRDDVSQSENFRKTGQGERLRIFIAEVEDTGVIASGDGLVRRTDERGVTFISVGVLSIRDNDFAQHVSSHDVLGPLATAAKESGGFVWVDVVVTDFRAGEVRNGTGAALIEKAKEYAIENGKTTIYLDHWTGGTGRLTQYYDRLGFKQVRNFELKRKNGTIWSGWLVRMDIAKSE